MALWKNSANEVIGQTWTHFLQTFIAKEQEEAAHLAKMHQRFLCDLTCYGDLEMSYVQQLLDSQAHQLCPSTPSYTRISEVCVAAGRIYRVCEIFSISSLHNLFQSLGFHPQLLPQVSHACTRVLWGNENWPPQNQKRK